MSVKTFLAGCVLLAYCTSYVSADNSTINFNSFVPRSTNCPAGQFGTATTACAPCPSGYYSSRSGSSSCTPASIGFFVANTGSTFQTPCSAGYFTIVPGSSICLPCMPGSYKPSPGIGSCVPADPGYFVPGLAAFTETQCPSGMTTIQPGSIACIGCPPGSYCQSGQSSQPCPAGYYSTAGQSSCSRCASGSFTSIAGSTSCCPCCANFYAASPGSSGCDSCPSGKYTDPGSKNRGDCRSSPQNYQVSNSCSQSAQGVCPVSAAVVSPIGRRDNIKRSKCLPGQKVCPIYGYGFRGGAASGYDCVNVQKDLESCGGCVGWQTRDGERSEDGGRDCSAIPHVASVHCLGGRCIIDSCRRGFTKSTDGEHCVSLEATLIHQAGQYKL